ncbi:MAG: DUF6073 family protein [Alphaproteobacteria bacterium]|jgi:hypothetical protein
MQGDYNIAWGPYVDPKGLPDLYAGDVKVQKRTVPEPGIDNLGLLSSDYFHILGMGDFEVDFEGYFQVVRGKASSSKWEEAAMIVNYTDLKLFGSDPKLGAITVSLNRNVLSTGETFPNSRISLAAKCRIAVSAQFDMQDRGMTLFNQEPILLKNDNLQAIPPINEPSTAVVYDIPLYDVKDPQGKPRAYLSELNYTVLDYVDKAVAEAYRKSGSEKEFKEILSR